MIPQKWTPCYFVAFIFLNSCGLHNGGQSPKSQSSAGETEDTPIYSKPSSISTDQGCKAIDHNPDKIFANDYNIARHAGLYMSETGVLYINVYMQGRGWRVYKKEGPNYCYYQIKEQVSGKVIMRTTSHSMLNKNPVCSLGKAVVAAQNDKAAMIENGSYKMIYNRHNSEITDLLCTDEAIFVSGVVEEDVNRDKEEQACPFDESRDNVRHGFVAVYSKGGLKVDEIVFKEEAMSRLVKYSDSVFVSGTEFSLYKHSKSGWEKIITGMAGMYEGNCVKAYESPLSSWPNICEIEFMTDIGKELYMTSVGSGCVTFIYNGKNTTKGSNLICGPVLDDDGMIWGVDQEKAVVFNATLEETDDVDSTIKMNSINAMMQSTLANDICGDKNSGVFIATVEGVINLLDK